MSMQCVERTLEYLDGQVLVALLRANSLDAHLFDENFVRQNWFEVLAYGGFRIMVSRDQLGTARELLTSFRNNELELPHEDVERPTCPACGQETGEADPGPRRWIFIAYLLFDLAFFPAAYLLSDLYVWLSLSLVFWLFVSIPHLIRYFVIGRYRCTNCLAAWRTTPAQPFFEQQRQAQAALDALTP